jgi:hypothetical protein
MADDTDSAGLGLIVGIIAVVVVLILALTVGPIILKPTPGTTNVTIEAPREPAPVPRG